MPSGTHGKTGVTRTELTALFLQQSLQDSVADLRRSLSDETLPHWDAIILTASNELQAEGYRRQIALRRETNRLPKGTEFYIVPDEGGKRIGSAGSTLSVIRLLQEQYGSLEGRRFLCIHAGGDSKRCPQYSALGKLFSPVPTEIDGMPATLFDMFLLTMASMPGRLREGMLLLAGDVMLLFNPLMCDFGTAGAAVVSFKEDVETGKNHGVYLRGENGNVKAFLHKLPEEKLRELGAVDERGNCSIDTGCMYLSPEILKKLYALADTPEKYHAMVNEQVRLSLYGDIAYCLAENSTEEAFMKEKPEGEYCEALTEARKKLWAAIGGRHMKLLNLAPAKFVHFGSIPEIMELMNSGVEKYRTLGWNRQINSSIGNDAAAGYNAVLAPGAEAGENCYLEVSYVHSGGRIGRNCYLSFVDIHDETVPDDVVLHALKQTNGKFVCRIFGRNDNPKESRLFGIPLEETGLGVSAGTALWNAAIYPECDTIRQAVSAALKIHAVAHGKAAEAELPEGRKKSLAEGFLEADPQAIIDWTRRMEELVRMDAVAQLISEEKPASLAAETLRAEGLTPIQQQWLEKKLGKLDISREKDFSDAIRLNWYLGKALNSDEHKAKCFRIIAEAVLSATMAGVEYNKEARITREEVTVQLPLRVNWGGGWTDTAPYCIENGGVVLNAAVKLKGKLPVEVHLVKIKEKKIVFDSRDMDVHGEFTDLSPLQKTGDPFDPFALQKACLVACGIIPAEGVSSETLEEILTRMGGGFEMHSEVTDVPKGSGLGTSSILSAAAVKAMLEFTGGETTEDKLYATVLAMEQIMSTGGGWQDQVGGVTNGIKYITSTPGIAQKIKVEHVEVSEETKKALAERFCLIYTGQRRLARNLLRDVVGRYVGNEPESIEAHREIQKLAALMKFTLERGDVDEFAHLLDRHWKESQKIDTGSSNTLIEQIFLAIEDMIDARMVCGAGGGGFLQVMLKKGVTSRQVHERLKEVFQDFAVDVWPCEIVY